MFTSTMHLSISVCIFIKHGTVKTVGISIITCIMHGPQYMGVSDALVCTDHSLLQTLVHDAIVQCIASVLPLVASLQCANHSDCMSSTLNSIINLFMIPTHDHYGIQ